MLAYVECIMNIKILYIFLSIHTATCGISHTSVPIKTLCFPSQDNEGLDSLPACFG